MLLLQQKKTRKTKKLIAEKLGDLSMIWNLRNSTKSSAHSDGIFSWSDPRFNIYNYTGHTETSELIQSLIEINKQNVKLYDMNFQLFP